MTAAERPLDAVLRWVPYYHAAKLLLLVWLQSASYEGAARLYIEGLRPQLAAWQPALDEFLAALLRSLVGRNGRWWVRLQPRAAGGVLAGRVPH